MLSYRCSQCGGVNRVPEARSGDSPRCGRCKNPLDVTGAPQEVDPEGLARAIDASPVPVLVDFWAPWCGPCRSAAPIVDRIARRAAGRVLVLKLNSDDFPDDARRHRVSGIPAFVLFRNGHEAGRQVGLLPEGAFARWVDQAQAS